jgi:TRAP-type C4-dicarboxylate transport system substrate-binding protein
MLFNFAHGDVFMVGAFVSYYAVARFKLHQWPAAVIRGFPPVLSTLLGSKLHEVKKVITLTGHFKAVVGLAIGEQYFQSLPKDIQQLLAEEAEENGRWVSPITIQKEDEFKQALAKGGVTFVQADTEAYRKATLATYKAFPKWTPGLYERV